MKKKNECGSVVILTADMLGIKHGKNIALFYIKDDFTQASGKGMPLIEPAADSILAKTLTDKKVAAENMKELKADPLGAEIAAMFNGLEDEGAQTETRKLSSDKSLQKTGLKTAKPGK